MPATKEQKAVLLNELIEMFQDGQSIFFSQYRGMTVAELQNLRRTLRSKNVQYKVAKKTLIRLAADKIGYKDVPLEVMDGPIGVAVGLDDPFVAAKMIHTLGKEYKHLKLVGGLMEGKVLTAAMAKEYAVLPGREELLGKLVFLLNSPVQGFYSVLKSLLGNFVRATDGYRSKMEKGI